MPLNPDDIKRRAERVGYHIKITKWRDNDTFMDMGLDEHGKRYFPTLCWNSDESEEKGWQAALDLIEAEERRQACPNPKCEGGKAVELVVSIGDEKTAYGHDCPDCKGTGEKVKA